MYKFGAWVHSHDDIPLDNQFRLAKQNGIHSIRSYSISYSEKIADTLKNLDMSLYGGIHVDSEALIKDWRSQVKLDELEKYHKLGVQLEAICVGNELRQFGDEPDKKRFTARLSFGLANVLAAYRKWLDEHGDNTPLTYAMEGIVFDKDGIFYDHLWPLIDALDIISINLYPMGQNAWHGASQFDESRQFLQNSRVRNDRMLRYEVQLRNVLQALEGTGKPVMLSETGFPSALNYERDKAGHIVPVNDNERYGEVMDEFLNIVDRANADFGNPIKAIYFYEWRDNLYHTKITNVEQSPIHCAFGLCDRFGNPKFDIKTLLARHGR
jgi:hypothetical protein